MSLQERLRRESLEREKQMEQDRLNSKLNEKKRLEVCKHKALVFWHCWLTSKKNIWLQTFCKSGGQARLSTSKVIRLKVCIALYGKPFSQLWDITYHIGSHSLPPDKWMRPVLTAASELVFDLPTPEGWKAELTYRVSQKK